jgi:hypothetical protein
VANTSSFFEALFWQIRQVYNAIFFAIARDPKFEFRIVDLGFFTNGAAMHRIVG